MHACTRAMHSTEAKEQLAGDNFLFVPCGSEDQSQVSRLGCKCLYHLDSSGFMFTFRTFFGGGAFKCFLCFPVFNEVLISDFLEQKMSICHWSSPSCSDSLGLSCFMLSRRLFL